MTAAEFYTKYSSENAFSFGSYNSLIDIMNAYAKMRVTEALQEASEKARAYADGNGEWTSSSVRARIDKKSILNAYNLDQIK